MALLGGHAVDNPHPLAFDEVGVVQFSAANLANTPEWFFRVTGAPGTPYTIALVITDMTTAWRADFTTQDIAALLYENAALSGASVAPATIVTHYLAPALVADSFKLECLPSGAPLCMCVTCDLGAGATVDLWLPPLLDKDAALLHPGQDVLALQPVVDVASACRGLTLCLHRRRLEERAAHQADLASQARERQGRLALGEPSLRHADRPPTASQRVAASAADGVQHAAGRDEVAAQAGQAGRGGREAVASTQRAAAPAPAPLAAPREAGVSGAASAVPLAAGGTRAEEPAGPLSLAGHPSGVTGPSKAGALSRPAAAAAGVKRGAAVAAAEEEEDDDDEPKVVRKRQVQR